MGYTKIDVAEAHIRTAVRLFFEDRHPVPIHLLACSAREILTFVGKAQGTETILEEVAAVKGVKEGDVIKKAHAFVNFMKHANRDAGATLEGFSDLDNDPILWFVCQDFGRVTGGMPIEAQVYEAWFFATFVKRVSDGPMTWQRLVRRCIRLFPHVRSVPRQEQKAIGLRALEKALTDPSLEMQIRRIVTPPRDDGSKPI
jgi:hypothetical protein